jgi:hypothetical protein
MRNKRQNKRPYFNLGQAMVEMIIITFATLLILLSLLHFGFMYNAKTVLNYAAYEAARAGSLNYGSPQAMNYALARVLASLETSPAPDKDFYDIFYYQTSQDAAIEMVDKGQFVCMQRISPTNDNGHWLRDPEAGALLPKALPYTSYIPNDHLVYRSAAPDANGLSIQDANLLKIKVTYCPKIITPIIGITMKRLMLQDYADTDPDPLEGWTVPTTLGKFTKACYEDDRIPIVSQAVIRMQTPIRDYAFTADCS